jgi:predicted ATP-dependent endonuclease of OLD family
MKAREQAEMIDEISTTIEGDLNKFWDQKTVEVNVREANSNYIPLVRDSEIGGEDVSREPRIPSERSNGFQWFLSFYINSKAEANDSNKKLFLLDDPAVYLHPEGKEDWLDAIEDLAEDNQIIYTSHSPYLIYKNRPSRVRIVEDQSESGTVVLDEFHSSNTASLEPLRNALGIGIGSSPFATKKKILVEGPSDKYILRGAIHYLDERGKDILQRNSISIIPTGGADKMIKAAKWVNSENFSYVVVLDKDQKGDTVVNRLKTDAPDLNEERIIQLEVDDDNINQHIEIEDMIPADFYVNCVNDVYQDEIDKYTPLKLSKEEGQKYINSVEYNDRKITSKINQVFDSAGYGDLDKLMVAKKIENRFISGEVDEDILSEFVILLGELAERI